MEHLEALFARFCAAADAGALAEVFDALAPELLRLARHLVQDRTEAEDLVQATFLAAIERRATFDATRKLRPWLAGILVKEAARVRRERARELDPGRLDSRTEAAPEQTLAARELANALAAALELLTPAEREVLVPVLLDGKRAVEVARELGTRPDTIHMRVHRGLARLRRLLPAGFGLGVLASLANARSLARVRHAVLEGARLELGLAGSGTAAVLLTGGFAMNKVLLTSLAVAVAIAAWIVLPREERTLTSARAASQVEQELVAPETSNATGSAPPRSADAGPRVALASAADSQAKTRLELLAEDGSPIATARVAYLGADDQVHAATTDATGTCVLPRADTVDLYVLRETSPLIRTRADLSAARSRATLPEDKEVSGSIELADGSSPGELDLEVALTSDRVPADLATVDERVLALLGTAEGRGFEARTSVDESGRFRFRGLPADWSGTLRLPSLTWLREEGPRDRASDVILSAPAHDLHLRLELRPGIHGRLVDASSGRPLARAQGWALIRFSSGSSMMQGITTGQQGGFRCLFAERTDVEALEFTRVRSAEGRTFEAPARIELAERDDPTDVGDVACEPEDVRTLALRTVDPEGRPVPSAKITIRGEGDVRTDERGRATLPSVPLSEPDLRIRAEGFATAMLDPLSFSDSESTVVLRPTNELAIQVAPVSSSMAGIPRVAVVGSQPLFGPVGPGARARERPRTSAGRFVGGSTERGDTRFEWQFAPDAEGRLVFEELRPGLPFEVRLLDPFGGLLASRACEPLGASERRVIDLRPDRPVRTIAGRIVDAEGRPIARAHVLYSGEKSGFGVPAGADGRFRLEHALEDSFNIGITKRGYAPATLHASDFPADGSELAIRLERAHDVRVSLVDPTGSPVSGARVDVRRAGPEGAAILQRLEEASPGEFPLRDATEGEVTFLIEVGGGWYEHRHRTSEPIARIELPASGRVECRWPVDLRADEGHWYQVTLRSPEADRRAIVGWTPSFPKPAEASFPTVLPGTWTIGIEVAERRAGDQAPVFVPLHAPKTIEVRTGETTRVELDR